MKLVTKEAVVRILNIEDLNQFFDLRLESLKDSPASFLSSFDEEKERGPSFYEAVLSHKKGRDNVIFGAFFENDLIGCLGIYRESGLKVNHKTHIWGTYVKPLYRENGVGKALLKSVLQYAKDTMQCTYIKLSVEENNISAKKLYESFGFEVWGMEPKAIQVDGIFYNELHMALVV